jgi:hypothetical protein
LIRNGRLGISVLAAEAPRVLAAHRYLAAAFRTNDFVVQRRRVSYSPGRDRSAVARDLRHS